MTKKITGRLCLTVTVALIIGVPACSEGDAPPGQDPQTVFESAVAEAMRNADPDAPPEDNNDEIQHFLVDCMRSAGFTYHPSRAEQTWAANLGMTDREFALSYGFGISTLIPQRVAALMNAPADPNEAVREGMSEAERVAFDRELLACQQRVVIELGVLPGGPVRLPEGSPLSKALVRAAEAAEADPRLAEARAQMAGCMREQGFDTTESAEADLVNQTQPFEQAYTDRGRELVAAGSSWNTLTVADVLPPAQVEQLEQIQVIELAVAAAGIACEDKLHTNALIKAVHREYLEKELADL